jgi:tetratricopeptide (TPR) repeat protein
MVISWFKNIKSRKLSKQNGEAKVNLDKDDLLEFFTETGEQIFIEKEEYKKKVLPHNLQLNWDNPQGLYDTIHGALRDGFYEEILEASNRLLEIDQNPERSNCVASIVLMKNQRILDARSLLENYINQYGSSAIILTNLAKTYNDTKTIKEILWHGILLDPNSEHTLDYWLAIINEQEGKEKYEKGLQKIMNLPNSWLAQMYLAFSKLQDKNLKEAMPLIKHVLKIAPKESQALFGLSGALGKNGYYKEIIKFILPRCTPEIGYREGVIHNILSTFCDLKMPREGLNFIKDVRSSFAVQTSLEKIEENLIEDDLKKHEEQLKLILTTL